MIARRVPHAVVLVVLLLHGGAAIARAKAPAPDDSSAVAELRREAASLAPLARIGLGRRFLAATEDLPHVTPRTLRHDSGEGRAPRNVAKYFGSQLR
jgi:hypothetical protein